MKKENINVVKADISLEVGDNIIDNNGNIIQVACIHYDTSIVVAVSQYNTTAVGGGLSDINKATIITFDTIASGYYQKVVEYSF